MKWRSAEVDGSVDFIREAARIHSEHILLIWNDSGWRTESGDCEFVVLPNSLLEMWTVLKLCIKNDKYILMQAANTSLTGGSTPMENIIKAL